MVCLYVGLSFVYFSLTIRIYNLKRFCWWSKWNDRNDYDCDFQLVSYFYSSFSFKIYNHFGSISKKQVLYKSKSNNPALCFAVHLHIDQFPLGTGFFICWRLVQIQSCCFQEWRPAPSFVLSVLLFHGWGPGIGFGCPIFPRWRTVVEKGKCHLRTIPITRKQMKTKTLRFHLVRLLYWFYAVTWS